MNLHLEPLNESHRADSFSCHATYLEEYLRLHALREMQSDLARTMVLVDGDNDPTRIVGYFTLRTMLGFYLPETDELTEAYIYPVELASLARSIDYRGKGIGTELMVAALRQVDAASGYVGFPGVALTATREGSVLYERFGFIRLYPDGSEMYLPLMRLRTILAALTAIE